MIFLKMFLIKMQQNTIFYVFSISLLLKGYFAQNLFFSRLCRRFVTLISRFLGFRILVTLVLLPPYEKTVCLA